MAEVATAFVSLVPSAKGFGRGIENEIGGDVDRAGKRSGTRFGGGMAAGVAGVGSRIFAPIAAAAGAVAIGGVFTDLIGEAREAQKVGALTSQVIKTTGGAAKVTAGQVADLATAISNKTGIDDETIQSGANLLLTFKQVRNEVGKGNNVFDRATQSAADLSAAGFGSISSTSKQLGKALNDPVKGLTALGRAGVTFTQEQKDQVKAMVESGDVLGAQKLILGEVESQVGGAAAASATAGEKMSVAFGNLKEQLGTALLPVVDKVAGFLTSKVIPAVSTFITQMQSGEGAGGAFVSFLKGIWAAVQPIGAFLINTVVPAVRSFFASFQQGGGASGVTTLFQQIVTFIQTKFIPAFMGIVSAVRGFIAVALPIVAAFVNGMRARIEPLMPQIRAVFSTIGQIITSALGLIQAVIQRVTAVIGFIWNRWGSSIMDFIGKVFKSVITIVGGALRVVLGVIRLVTSLIKGDWSGAWDAIKTIVSGAWDAIKGIVQLAIDSVKGTISGAAGILKAAGEALFQGLIDGISSKIQAVKDKVGEVAQAIRDFFPGSPVKDGPLTSWNNGAVGERLGGLLADGMDSSRSKVAAASRALASQVALPTASYALAGVGGAGGGVTKRYDQPINIYGDVVTPDPLAFEREMNDRRRQQALGRRRAP